ncbi:MAG TPA: hypothetical protein VNS55_07290 [Nocardioides sp.]|nr:hypothetical protein [Nocardioides sp.]
MIGHLGPRVSALLDGQLPAQEAEEAWAHVYACHACRDLVEREGWVKTQLAGLSSSGTPGSAPSDLKGSLLSMPPGERYLVEARGGARRGLGVAVLGGGALGAAMLGVLALGAAPGSAPPADRRPPASRIESPSPTLGPTTGVTDAVVRHASGSRSLPEAVPAWVRLLVD